MCGYCKKCSHWANETLLWSAWTWSINHCDNYFTWVSLHLADKWLLGCTHSSTSTNVVLKWFDGSFICYDHLGNSWVHLHVSILSKYIFPSDLTVLSENGCRYLHLGFIKHLPKMSMYSRDFKIENNYICQWLYLLIVLMPFVLEVSVLDFFENPDNVINSYQQSAVAQG